jgi:hypothetical protein
MSPIPDADPLTLTPEQLDIIEDALAESAQQLLRMGADCAGLKRGLRYEQAAREVEAVLEAVKAARA